jgi:hypothetical protein
MRNSSSNSSRSRVTSGNSSNTLMTYDGSSSSSSFNIPNLSHIATVLAHPDSLTVERRAVQAELQRWLHVGDERHLMVAAGHRQLHEVALAELTRPPSCSQQQRQCTTTETDYEWLETMALVERYRFSAGTAGDRARQIEELCSAALRPPSPPPPPPARVDHHRSCHQQLPPPLPPPHFFWCMAEFVQLERRADAASSLQQQLLAWLSPGVMAAAEQGSLCLLLHAMAQAETAMGSDQTSSFWGACAAALITYLQEQTRHTDSRTPSEDSVVNALATLSCPCVLTCLDVSQLSRCLGRAMLLGVHAAGCGTSLAIQCLALGGRTCGQLFYDAGLLNVLLEAIVQQQQQQQQLGVDIAPSTTLSAQDAPCAGYQPTSLIPLFDATQQLLQHVDEAYSQLTSAAFALMPAIRYGLLCQSTDGERLCMQAASLLHQALSHSWPLVEVANARVVEEAVQAAVDIAGPHRLTATDLARLFCRWLSWLPSIQAADQLVPLAVQVCQKLEEGAALLKAFDIVSCRFCLVGGSSRLCK